MKILAKFTLMGISFLLFFISFNQAEAYNFSYAGLYDKVQIRDVNNDELFNYINGGTEDFITELADHSKGIDVIDSTPDVTAKRNEEILTQLEMGSTPMELKDVDAEYIIYGCVTSLGKGNSKQGLLFVNGESDTVRLDLSVRIIEKKTGKIVFTATAKGEGQAKGIGLLKVGNLKFSKEALYQAASKAMVQAADKIKKAI